jgi:hypothetical protein
MKNSPLTYLILFFCICFSCTKPTGDNFSGILTVSGSIYLNDTLSGYKQPQFVPKQTILLKSQADSNTQNFIISIQTDIYGNFIFNNVSPNNYILYSERDSNGIVYSATVKINLVKVDTTLNLVLNPDSTKYNLLNIICHDSLTNGLLNNVPICLFASRLIADSNKCKGSFFNAVTNAFGRVLVSKIPNGEIYINATDSVGTSVIRTKDSVLMPVIGIKQKDIYLK